MAYTVCRPADADAKCLKHLVRDRDGATHTHVWSYQLDVWVMPLPGGRKYRCAANMSEAGFTYIQPVEG